MIKIVNFCGGRGSNSIVRELIQYPFVRLTNIVNAYDDGKSTGHIRRFFRMLGPSDIRKNQLVMMTCMNKQDEALKLCFEFRFPEKIEYGDAVESIQQILGNRQDRFGLQEKLSQVDNRRRKKITEYLQAYIDNVSLYERVAGEEFPYEDCSLANCIYAGAFEIYHRDFGLTVDFVGKLFNMRGETITNSNENRNLVAIRENGFIMNSEAEIVESRTNIRIHDIFIVDRPLTFSEKQNLDALSMGDKVRYLKRFSNNPPINNRCLDAIKEADIILYSPGTQHSSLYPTYLTAHLGNAIRRNSNAMKIFLANIGEDYETPAYSVSELVEGALQRLKSSDQGNHPTKDYIHFVIANNVFGKKEQLSKYIRFDPDKVETLGTGCVSGNYEDPVNWGKHDAKKIVELLFSLLDQFD